MCASTSYGKTENKESTSNFNMYPRIINGERKAITIRAEKSTGSTTASYADGTPVTNERIPNYLLSLQYFMDELIFGAELSVAPISVLANAQYDVLKEKRYKIGIGAGVGTVDYNTDQVLIPYSIHTIFSVKVIEDKKYELTPYFGVQYLTSYERLKNRPKKGTTNNPTFNTVDRVEKMSYQLGLANDFKLDNNTLGVDVYGGIQDELHRSNVTSVLGTSSNSKLDHVVGIKFSFGF